MTGTHEVCNAVIEELAQSEHRLLEQVNALAERAVVAEADLAAMRLVAVAGLQYSHDLQRELADLRERHLRALDNARELRAHILKSEAQGDWRAA